MDNPPEDGPCEVTITAPDHEWLQSFSRQLVEDRLAAAAHLDLMHTTYRWAGDVCTGVEARARLHTRIALVGRISAQVQSGHPYEVPCVAATPIVAGEKQYVAWIMSETHESRATSLHERPISDEGQS